MKQMKKELKTTYKKVEDILKNKIECRNSDKRLFYEVLQRYTHYKFSSIISFEDFKSIPSFETFRRNRQKIQNDEKRYLPYEKVSNGRLDNEKEVQEYLFSDEVMTRINI